MHTTFLFCTKATPELVPSLVAPAVNRARASAVVLIPPEALKLMQKLCGRYEGPLSPKPTEDTLSQQMEFVTRDGRVVKINIADQRAKLGL
jgi:hypothetical protein